jgi:serine/threonine-protein kinase
MQRLGAFELHRVIGEGGMSQVWSGVHVDTEVPVAIKVLTAEVARSSSFASALESEVRAVASLHHPNIVTVLDYGYVP